MQWNTSADFAPLVLFVGAGHQRRIVRTLRDAAEVLMVDWPFEDGEEYVAAVKACADAVMGQAGMNELRELLLRAAREAGMGVLTVIPDSGKTMAEMAA
ncbi:hypothetical protein B5K08_00980 [Rhizobium leguminosarum bv. trifolii]|uniref:DUF982 domain-containing protein n=1 Tax=Rhizobium leguminosarum bv. trifolii TaxID=386 RepID=A0A3E1BZD1_RHILT|nr:MULTISPECIES: DUF982 domain-containing protein [Rhizobium]ANM08719.1 hypothetical protein AMK05_CH00275 [Rhizobium sp. N324]ANM15230.1 hypothetical protein AMK06_CH00276 [Rhizobium sp. N541]ANM21618.1 hypothetical protein AMK07_CH00276 [Rhizobium sp. N941]OYD02282.1 hypothetical protein AMK08_CH100270 [Rhizobium sp. N4311]RFC00482.1 hypothetical protein B5K08_00980 [Rhizobium leguminosarum bv. trifolii]